MTFETKPLPKQPYLYVEKTCEYADIASAMGEAFGAVFGFVASRGIAAQSKPMTVYLSMPSGSAVTFRGAVMVSPEDANKADGDIRSDALPEGDAVCTVHTGPYAGLGKTHQALWSHMKENGIEGSMPVWEVYIDDPGDTVEAELRTELYCAVAK